MASSYTLIERLASHLQRPVDAATRARARLHLLDWLACVAGARASRVAGIAFAARSEDVLLRSAFLGNLLEMDDVHRGALLHPGPVVWPIALTTPTLDHALDCAVRGYEAMIAIGETFDQYHYSHWHPTSSAGVFGATTAECFAAFGGGANLLINALGNAGSIAGGLWHMRHDDVMTKQWHIAHAVRTARDIAHLADCGLTGSAAILEGPQGLYAAMTREARPMAFPGQWRIHEVSFKPWAACRHAHPAIDCALELRAQGRLTAPFNVHTYADAITFCDRPDPVNEVEAKFSIQHAIAVIADGRDAAPADFTPQAIAELASLRSKVELSEDPAITARYPAHFGARLNGFELVDTTGDPERPMNADQIIAKARTLVAWGGLLPSEADRAADLALQGDSPAAIAAMLGDWLT